MSFTDRDTSDHGRLNRSLVFAPGIVRDMSGSLNFGSAATTVNSNTDTYLDGERLSDTDEALEGETIPAVEEVELQ
ncbi:hypothetical protein EVJ58_g6119 [Rhodofomes roseus]|uniref:Uncharacterized protein n=1 Tax=Rhodofomes roseus TaxID=34475 RepID=A0A4Y9Y9A3_9APHY|nr:hypothetical protein EVJ58_g6119 [Rhodofomes roseus]